MRLKFKQSIRPFDVFTVRMFQVLIIGIVLKLISYNIDNDYSSLLTCIIIVMTNE